MARKQKGNKLELTDFWRELGSDPPNKLAVKEYSDKTKRAEASIIALAIVEVFSFDRLTSLFIGPPGSPPSFHFYPSDAVRYIWRRKLQLTIWVGILAALIYSSVAIFRVCSPSPSMVRSHIAQRKDGLPAYHKLDPQDLMTLTGDKVGDGAPIGRYTLKLISEKAIIKEDDLLSADLSAEMIRRSVLFIPVSASSISSSLEPNSKLTIIVSWPEPRAGTDLVSDVILLGVERRPDSVTLAVGVTNDQFNKIRVLLADSKFHVAK